MRQTRSTQGGSANRVIEEPKTPEASEVSSPPRTFLGTLTRLGPGMIIAGSIVGSGELIATTKTGAEAGFTLLWLIIIGCVIKVFTQVEFGRNAIIWGQTPLKALDDVPGPRLKVNWIVWFWAIMTLLVITQQGGIVGGVGQALTISRPLTKAGAEYNVAKDELVRAQVELAIAERNNADAAEIERLQASVATFAAKADELEEPHDAYYWATIIAVITSVLLYVGRYGLIQIIATFLVAIFTAITIFTLLMLQIRPDWAVTGADVASGVSFRLPQAIEGLTEYPLATALAAFGIIGVGAFELIMYPYWCLEKGYAKHTGPRDETPQWTERARGWMRVLQTDAWLSMAVYTFATVAFYLLGAAVLHQSRLNPAGADMIRTLSQMYVPVFGGKWAPKVFLFGAFSVLYSTYFVAAAGNARMIADALGLFGLTDGSEKARMKWTRIFSGLWPLVAVAVFWIVGWLMKGQSPAAMILLCGVGQAVMLPMLGVAALYFRFRKCDECLQPSRLWDAMLWISFLAFLIAGTWAAYSKIMPYVGG